MRSVELLQELPSSLQTHIRPVMQRNSYWAHPEAVLQTMVADEDPAVRGRAVRTIQQCRQQPPQEVRPYVLPMANFSAGHYTELLNWDTELITEPPLTMGLSNDELQCILGAPLEVEAYPVHTVAVERTVKVVTAAARAVIGERQRHGWICRRLCHR